MTFLAPGPRALLAAAALACTLTACSTTPPCDAGVSCSLATASACQVGVTACTASGSVCQAVAVADNTSCGTGFGCSAGSCVALDPLTTYWTFERHRIGALNLGYDTNVSPGGAGACPQSGVDTVVVTDLSGTPVLTAPCVYLGVQGATAYLVPGTYDLLVTGYQGSVQAYQQQIQVNVPGSSVQVSVPGIEDDLDLLAHFWNRLGTSQDWATCSQAGVQSLTYNLFDGARNPVASGSVSCGVPAGASFRVALGTGLDRDSYTLRMQGFPTVTPVLNGETFDSASSVANSCGAASFVHHGTNIGAAAWNVELFDTTTNGTVCN